MNATELEPNTSPAVCADCQDGVDVGDGRLLAGRLLCGACLNDANDPEDWPVHRPAAPEAPIPGRHWYAACNPDRPRVRPDGVCAECGGRACPVCGCEPHADGRCEC